MRHYSSVYNLRYIFRTMGASSSDALISPGQVLAKLSLMLAIQERGETSSKISPVQVPLTDSWETSDG